MTERQRDWEKRRLRDKETGRMGEEVKRRLGDWETKRLQDKLTE